MTTRADEVREAAEVLVNHVRFDSSHPVGGRDVLRAALHAAGLTWEVAEDIALAEAVLDRVGGGRELLARKLGLYVDVLVALLTAAGVPEGAS